MSKTTFIKILVIVLLSDIGLARGQGEKQRPNIILFLVDDMGWQDTSVPFWDKSTPANQKFLTPNMERLAASGMKFTQAYANSICTPSRVSLLSGSNVARHRVTNWTMFKNQSTDAVNDSLLTTPDWNVNGLSPVQGVEKAFYATPLPQILRDNGYYTIHCGKAHFGADQTPGANPLNLGFTKNIAGSAAGNPASFLSENNYGNIKGTYNLRAVPGLDKYWGTGTFLTEALTREAMLAMDTAAMMHKPFFLYMAHFAVHLPYDGDQRFLQKYIDGGLSKSEAAYATLVEGMDKSLGDLMDYLYVKNLTEQTIIIFMSDNGGYSHLPREGVEDTQNFPLKSGKGSLYEGGIREPMLISWPGITPANSVCEQYLIIEDFYPTVLEMAAVKKYHTVQQLDGRSIIPYIKGKKEPTRELIWNFPNKWAGGKNDRNVSWSCAIRRGDWKLIYFERSKKLELYDIREDISELHDLSDQYPSKVRKLARILSEKLRERNGQIPLDVHTLRPIPYPDELF